VVGVVALAGCMSANQGKVVDQINASRKANGVPAVTANDVVMGKAQAWSDHMAKTGVLEHTGGGTRVDTSGIPKWCAVGENVGQGSSTYAVHQAFLNSAPHRANMLNRHYNRVGTGVTTGRGSVWVTEIYYQAC
jgi:uncharacterized protein YkwD